MDYRTSLGVVQNFPKSGVTFFDINPILANKDFFCGVVDDFLKKWENKGIEKIVAIESRGFILGSALALKMSLGFVPIRKAGKLPGEVFSSSYTLEYGDDALEIQKNALQRQTKVLLVDDVLATGGTAAAAVCLLKKLDVTIVGAAFFLGLKGLGGYKKLSNLGIETQKILSL